MYTRPRPLITCSGCSCALSIAVWTAKEPSLVAVRDDNEPRKLPIGVRTALAITTSFGLLPFPKPLAILQDRYLRSAGAENLLLRYTDKLDAISVVYSLHFLEPFQHREYTDTCMRIRNLWWAFIRFPSLICSCQDTRIREIELQNPCLGKLQYGKKVSATCTS